MSDEKMISVLGIEDKAELGWFSKPQSKIEYQRNTVRVEELRERVTTFLDSMRDVLAGVPDAVGNYHLHQLEVRAEVSAKGTVSLAPAARWGVAVA